MASCTLSNCHDHVYGVVRAVAASTAPLLLVSSTSVIAGNRETRMGTIGIEVPVPLIESCLVDCSRCAAVTTILYGTEAEAPMSSSLIVSFHFHEDETVLTLCSYPHCSSLGAF